MARKQATPAQKAAAKERRAKMRELASHISSMSQDQREALLERFNGIATIEGRVLSMHNTLMVALQYEDATIVGGFRQWREAGRYVRKGEVGMGLWYPIKPRKETADNNGEPTEDMKFALTTVFDVSQTDEIQDEQAQDQQTSAAQEATS